MNAPAVRALARACAADGVPGLAVPAAAAALCFADGTAEALVLDAVRFDPIDETSHANANVPARARLLRETLRATATLFAGAVAESVAVAGSSSNPPPPPRAGIEPTTSGTGPCGPAARASRRIRSNAPRSSCRARTSTRSWSSPARV